jgi:hypothetical protein
MNLDISPNDGDMEAFMKSYINNPLAASDGYFNSSYSVKKLEELAIQYIKENGEYFGE